MSNTGYEKKDIPVKPVAIGGAIFVIIIAVTLLLLHEYYIRVVDDTVYEFRLSKRSNKLIKLHRFKNPIDKSKELLLNDQEN